MYSTYIQRIEIALLSDPWCIQLTLNTDSRRSNTEKCGSADIEQKLTTVCALRQLDETNMYKNIATYKTKKPRKHRSVGRERSAHRHSVVRAAIF